MFRPDRSTTEHDVCVAQVAGDWADGRSVTLHALR